ncbi:MAG: YdeI/OmpD-associated family protein [Actinomycetes bacterium]
MSEVLACRDGAAWEAWLADHHPLQAGVWLKIAKKGSGQASVSNDEALDVALCYGWINGQRKPLDGSWYLQRYTPRRPRSTWSKVNVDKVEALTAAGRMRAPGMAEVEAAKADGRWDAAYEPARTATVPPDLAAALAQDERARRRYESLGRTDRYLVILRLQTASTPEARAARLRRMVATLAAGDPVR